MTQAVDLLVGIMIKAAIDESKGEFKGTPSSEIRAYDPKNEEEPDARSEKVGALFPSVKIQLSRMITW